MLRTVRVFAVFSVLCAFGLAGCGTTASTREAPAFAEPSAPAIEAYRIGIDDMVSVSVWRNEDLSVIVPVRPDGKISVPLVGDVPAAGRTPAEVAATIETELARFVRDPKVAVILTELRSHEYLSRVRVTGAVRNPVSLPHRQGMTVLDAVLAAGGLTEFAAPDRTVLYRRQGEAAQSYAVRLGSILERGELAHNYAVLPGDVITVPERVF